MRKTSPATLLAKWLIPLWTTTALCLAAPFPYAPVVPGYTVSFPRDFGAHPDYRTEWWYVTGWLTTEAGKPLGFQVTFFRSPLNIDNGNPSAFAPRELIFAHAALSAADYGSLLHEQRAARAGFGLAGASATDTDIWLDDWRLTRSGGKYRATIGGRELAMQLDLVPSQPLLLQGDRGYSRKGPLAGQASYYYSEPQLAVSGVITRAGKQETVRGAAWLDHEWSTAYLADAAVGWDWTGINLDDGGALMLFLIRGKDGKPVWAGGTRRLPDGSVVTFNADAVSFTPLEHWRSPRTGTDYPVAMRVEAGDVRLDLIPLMKDQELDSRASTGAVYWEGAVEAKRAGKTVGHGYLELTGYFKPLQL